MSEDTPAAPGGFAPGSRIAGYLLEEQIGQGGMAVVFRAHDELARKRAAPWRRPAHRTDGRSVGANGRRERAGLRHKGVCSKGVRRRHNRNAARSHGRI